MHVQAFLLSPIKPLGLFLNEHPALLEPLLSEPALAILRGYKPESRGRAFALVWLNGYEDVAVAALILGRLLTTMANQDLGAHYHHATHSSLSGWIVYAKDQTPEGTQKLQAWLEHMGFISRPDLKRYTV